MKTLKLTTFALAAAASLGALSLTAAPASAHGFGFHGGGHGHWHGGWGYRRFGFYGGPVFDGYYGADCYYIRRPYRLIKVCE